MGKIALVAITKNAEKELPRMINSVLPEVDGIWVTDTGSTDKTVEVVKAMGAVVSETGDQFYKTVTNKDVSFAKNFVGRTHLKAGDKLLDFAAARNHSFAQVPKEYDWILWLDSDDVLKGKENLRKVAEQADQARAGEAFFNYLYMVKLSPKGTIESVLVEHKKERLIRNNGDYHWIGMIHETTETLSSTPLKNVDIDSKLIEVVHTKEMNNITDATTRNIKSLESEIARTEGKDPRPIFYLAKSYFDVNIVKGDKNIEYYPFAEKLIQRYLHGDENGQYSSGWAEERCLAYDYLGKIYLIQREFAKAEAAYLMSFKEDPKFPWSYVGLAQVYSAMEDHEKAVHWVKLALQVPQPFSTLVGSPHELQTKILQVIYTSAIHQQNIDEAYEAMKQLAELVDHPDIKAHLEFITNLKSLKELSKHYYKIIDYYKATNNQLFIKPFLESIPPGIQTVPTVMELRKTYLPPKVWADDEIAIYCGVGLGTWSPKSWLKTGFGGSEEAVIHLSREFTRLGYKVTVYGDPGTEAGVYEGVEYKQHFECNFNDQFNIFIGWRNIALFDLPISAKKMYLDCHDVLNPRDFTPERLQKINKVMVKSQFHRGLIPDVPDSKIAVITNGLEIPEFKPRKRNPHKVFWGSSYDRGIQHLLKMWPDVLKAVPDATLEVCYGWDLFDKIFHDNPERMAWKDRINKMMDLPSITHHGRVGHPELEEIMSECSVWAYPTNFDEISCITAMRAQALDLAPITMDRAALKETVRDGVKIQGDIYDPGIQKEYLDHLIQELITPDGDWIDGNFWEWSKIASEWDKVLKEPQVPDFNNLPDKVKEDVKQKLEEAVSKR